MARTRDADRLVPALRAPAARDGMNTAARTARLGAVMPPSHEDHGLVDGGETRFARTARDQVLRRHGLGTVVAGGRAAPVIGVGLCLTDKGRKLVAS